MQGSPVFNAYHCIQIQTWVPGIAEINRGRRIRSSRSAFAVYWIWGQSRLHVILTQTHTWHMISCIPSRTYPPPPFFLKLPGLFLITWWLGDMKCHVVSLFAFAHKSFFPYVNQYQLVISWSGICFLTCAVTWIFIFN